MSLTATRLACFMGALPVFGLLEFMWPWRRRRGWWHQLVNMGIVVVDSLVRLVVVPVSLIEVALLTQRHGIGLLPLISMPFMAAAILGCWLLAAGPEYLCPASHLPPRAMAVAVASRAPHRSES